MRIPALSYGHGSQSMLQLGERMMTIIMTLSNSIFPIDCGRFDVPPISTYIFCLAIGISIYIPSLEFGPTPAYQTRIVPYRISRGRRTKPLAAGSTISTPQWHTHESTGYFPHENTRYGSFAVDRKKCISICYRKFYWKVIFSESSTPRERA